MTSEHATWLLAVSWWVTGTFAVALVLLVGCWWWIFHRTLHRFSREDE